MDVGAALLLITLSGPLAPAPQATSPGTPVPATAPAAPSPSAPAPTRPASVTLGVEAHRDRFDYRFENPSSFNTSELVPHFFVQRYDADNVWLTARVQYRIGGRPLETEGGLTATTTGVGSDYDTFFQPDGNVVVYGTTADTALQSWRIAQFAGLGSWRGFQARVGYSYRRDRSVYYPSFSTTIQTKPPSSSAFWNTDRETTVSEVHEVRLGVERSFPAGPRWSVCLTADVSPTTLARLTTILPDKYPEPVVFMAKGLSVDAGVQANCRIGRWVAGVVVTFARSWSYRHDSQFHRNAIGFGALVGR